MRALPSTAALSLLAITFAAEPKPVSFRTKPAVSRTDGKATVRFAVDAPTDVEVAVLDARNGVVRHLAAGKLGQKSPKPFRQGLVQSLEWDGKDDRGEQVLGSTLGPFRFRVGLGLRPRLHKIIGWSGEVLGSHNGIVTGPDGTLYVISSAGLYAHRQTWLIRAFDSGGNYLRQVFPGPANLPPEKRKGWPRIELDDGREVPVIFHLLPRTTYPGAVFAGRMFPVVTSDGRIIMLSGPGRTTIKFPDLRGGRRLLTLGTDGSVPENFLGPEVCPMVGGFGRLALSPDEKVVYATGFVDAAHDGKGPCNVVYHLALDGSQRSKILIGKPYQSGRGKDRLSDPQGISTDREGNLVIADYGNKRVVVFQPDGTYVGEIGVKYPDTVCISKKTGAIYVMQLQKRQKAHRDQHYYVSAHNWKARRVLKFEPSEIGLPAEAEDEEEGEEEEEGEDEDVDEDGMEPDGLDLALVGDPEDADAADEFEEEEEEIDEHAERPQFVNTYRSKYGGGAFLALDESGEEAVLWLSGLKYGGGAVLKIVDRGEELESLGAPIRDIREKDRAQYLGFIGDVAVTGDKVISRHPALGMHTNTSFVYSAETGEYTSTFVPKSPGGRPENLWNLVYGEMIAGWDGNLYVHAKSNLIRRYSPEGLPRPFPSTGKGFVEGFWHGHTRGAGMFIDWSGRIYISCSPADRKLSNMRVKVISPEGEVENDALVKVHGSRMGGLAVDREGNIYIGAQAVPKNSRIPEWFAGKLPPDSAEHHPSNAYKQYAAIYKFPPTGGEIAKDERGDYVGHCQGDPASVSVRGALWMRRLGSIGNHGDELGCHCETTRFDLDAYGRLFAPDLYRFCVYVLDGEGNEITHFGSYGNMDSRGPGSPVPEPEIAFGWPLSVECSGDRVFVADLVNRRVVAVKFEHEVVEECEIE